MMHRSGFRAIFVVLTAVAALSAVSYAMRGETAVESGLQAAKTGVVLDAQTRQPLPGVYVVARWLEQSSQASLDGRPGQTQGQCLFRTVVRTDGLGRYSIPASAGDFNVPRGWQPASNRTVFWQASAYAPGYAESAGGSHPKIQGATLQADTLEPILLNGDHAAPEQRVASLIDTLSRFACQEQPVPIAEEIYAEAYAAACLPQPNAAARALERLRNADGRDRRGHEAGSAVAEPCAEFRQASNWR